MTEYKYNKSELICQYLNQEKLERREAWQGFILDNDISWDWFATLTFRDYKSTYSAKRHFYRWLRLLNRKMFGKKAKYQDLSISWILGEERQSRGAIHYHALLGNTDKLMRKEWGKKWWELTGGYGRIDRARIKGATHYITKYILKDGDLDIDFRDEAGQHLTLDDPAGYTKAEEGRGDMASLPSEAR